MVTDMQKGIRYSGFLNSTAWLQGVYYSLTGIWPLVHMPSFIFVSGPKYDLWLVRTVGILILVQGLVIVSAAISRRISKEIVLLSVGAAAGLAIIDVYYASIDRIWDVYLMDAVAEAILISLWVTAWLKAGKRGQGDIE